MIFIIASLVLVSWHPLDQVLAATKKRILGPHELLDHSQSRPTIDELITARADLTLDHYAIDLTIKPFVPKQHTLGTNLASTERSKLDYLATRPDAIPEMVQEFNALDQDRETSAGRTTHVLNDDGKRQRIASVDVLLPLVQQRHAGDNAPGPHPLFELSHGGSRGQLPVPNRHGSEGQPLPRLSQSSDGQEQVDKQAHDADDAQIEPPLRPEGGATRCLGSRPLSAKVGASILAIIAAWLLVAWIAWLFWGLKRPYGVRQIAKLLPLSAAAMIFFAAPVWLDRVWPDVCLTR